jgi:hypothetical protein
MKKYDFILHGVLAPKIIENLNIPVKISNSSVVLLLGFANFSIKPGAKFNFLKTKDIKYEISATLEYITQQYSRPFSEIPLGWKTIVVINIDKGRSYFDALPIVEGWYESDLKDEIGYIE